MTAGNGAITCFGREAPKHPFGGYEQSGWGHEFGRDPGYEGYENGTV